MLNRNSKEYKDLIRKYHPAMVDEIVIEGLKLWANRKTKDLLQHLVATQKLYEEYRQYHKLAKYSAEDTEAVELPYITASKDEIESEVYNGLITIYDSSRYPMENAVNIAVSTLEEWRKRNS